MLFSFPPEPQFFFEDMEVAVPEPNIEVICHDWVMTKVDIHMESDDGTILADLTGIPIRLGPDLPGVGAIAESLTHEDVVMATPAVNFLKPEPLMASMDKTISILFDGLSTQGAIIVNAEGSSATYQHSVARW